MLRGVNRQTIFEEDADYEQFLQILRACKTTSGFYLLGYALLGNHVHLLIVVEQEPLSTVMRRIATRYAIYFNKKYERSGHLFQDRYKSEPVNDDRQLLSVLRYILQNPQKAGLEKELGCYRWSSYGDYMRTGDGPYLTDTARILSMLSSNEAEQPALLKEFVKVSDETAHLDDEGIKRPSDRTCKEMLKRSCGVDTATEIQLLPEEKRDDAIRLLKAEGASIRQIVRLTGVSFGVVRTR